MEYYGPYVAQIAFSLYRAIDWTHMHHEQTYARGYSRRIVIGTGGLIFG